MSEEKEVPEDILDICGFIVGMKSELPDDFWCSAKGEIEDLIDWIDDWRKNGSKEPSWDGFREAINELCVNDGMPRLFGE